MNTIFTDKDIKTFRKINMLWLWMFRTTVTVSGGCEVHIKRVRGKTYIMKIKEAGK